MNAIADNTLIAAAAGALSGDIQGSVADITTRIVNSVPNVLAMLVTLVVGYFVARWVARAVEILAVRLGLQKVAQRGGLIESMHKVGIRHTVPGIVGRIVFWLTMFVVVSVAFDLLGYQAFDVAVERIVAYIPQLLSASLVVVVGLLVATFLRGAVALGADRLGLVYAERLGTACYVALVPITFIAAFSQLGINFPLINEMILIAFTAVAAGLALSMGLGGRDVMANILAGYYTRQLHQAGDIVRVADLEGKVREVGPVATIIETEEDGLPHRRAIPNTRMLSEAIR
jgi:hypothetical protein